MAYSWCSSHSQKCVLFQHVGSLMLSISTFPKTSWVFNKLVQGRVSIAAWLRNSMGPSYPDFWSLFARLECRWLRLQEAQRSLRTAPQAQTAAESFAFVLCWNSPFLHTKGGMAYHPSHLQKELRENRLHYAWPFQNTHAYAKNTIHCTSGIGLIHESLTHGLIVFDKIPRILFMRNFWHNGKPWQAQDRSSRCPGLRPQRC